MTIFDWTHSPSHAISILKEDHEDLKSLFDDFETTPSASAKNSIIKTALEMLKIHAAMEEEVFYPAVRGGVEARLMNEADEEHHVAKILVAELESGTAGDHRYAKFKVLTEAVRHHIKEEEDKMLPQAEDMDLDFEAIGEKMLAVRQKLLDKGFPVDAEHKMVKKTRGADSPAANAKKFAKSRNAAKLTLAARIAKSRGDRPHT